MRVAFFGGSFDPPHLGHRRIALAAADRMALDRVLLVPVAVQPLKRGVAAPASYADRVAMLRLLVDAAADERLEVSELDAPRADGKPNYTFDTLEHLREELGAEDTLFLLTGADALETLPQWHRALELICSVGMIVATRPGFALEELYVSLLRLSPGSEFVVTEQEAAEVEHRVLVPGTLERGPVVLRFPASQDQAHSPLPAAHFYLLKGLDEDVSATAIRAALRHGGAHQSLDPAVLAYIRARGLYREQGPLED